MVVWNSMTLKQTLWFQQRRHILKGTPKQHVLNVKILTSSYNEMKMHVLFKQSKDTCRSNWNGLNGDGAVVDICEQQDHQSWGQWCHDRNLWRMHSLAINLLYRSTFSFFKRMKGLSSSNVETDNGGSIVACMSEETCVSEVNIIDSSLPYHM